MSLELFINSGSITEIDLSRIDGVRFEDAFSVSSTTCATLYYNVQDFSIPPVTPVGVLNIPETNYFMFDENAASDWNAATPTKIRISLKALGRILDRTNYQQKLFDIIKNRRVDSEITLTKLPTLNDSDPKSLKKFKITEANYLERTYDDDGQKFYSLEWGGTDLTETADFTGLFDYLPSSEDRKDGFFTLTVQQLDSEVNNDEPPSQGDELLICIKPSAKYGLLDVGDSTFDTINVDNILITSASLDSLIVNGNTTLDSISISGSLLINGKKFEELLNTQTDYGSLLLNYDNDTTTNPVTLPPYLNSNKSYFKLNGNWVNVPVTKVAVSMRNYSRNDPYYVILKDIVVKNQVGVRLTLTQLRSGISKTYRIKSSTKYGDWLEDDAIYQSESNDWIPGFIEFVVDDVTPPDYKLPLIESYVDDEYSINFDFTDLGKLYEKTVITQTATINNAYIIPSWAKKITIIAIGGGGGGGGGVGIYKDTDYPYCDSADLVLDALNSFNFKNYERDYIDIPINPAHPGFTEGNFEAVKAPFRYEVLVGGAGGAGGNVVWKQLTDAQFNAGDSIQCFIGKGGKGFKGGEGRVIPRGNNFEVVDYEKESLFKFNNSMVKAIRGYHRRNQILPVDGERRQSGKISHYLYTRSGQIGFMDKSGNGDYVKNLLSNSGGDTLATIYASKEGVTYNIIAEGGYGGFSGYGIPIRSDVNTGFRVGNYVMRLFGWPFEDDNGFANQWISSNFNSDPGASHKQTKNNTYDQILIGGPGGHGISMSVNGAERFFNFAPNLPWSIQTDRSELNNLFLPWGGGKRLMYYHEYRTVGYDLPSDVAPTGGGGGNGPILPLIKAREQFKLDNPGLDIDSIETIDRPDTPYGGKPGFYYIHDTRAGKGGRNKIRNTIFDGIPMGQGGDGGNFFDYVPGGISPSLPTNGGLYGGGGGGGASLFFDISTPEDEVVGQDGADGGDGVIIIIAEN